MGPRKGAACLTCNHVKHRCVGGNNKQDQEHACERCSKLKLTCSYMDPTITTAQRQKRAPPACQACNLARTKCIPAEQAEEGEAPCQRCFVRDVLCSKIHGHIEDLDWRGSNNRTRGAKACNFCHHKNAPGCDGSAKVGNERPCFNCTDNSELCSFIEKAIAQNQSQVDSPTKELDTDDDDFRETDTDVSSASSGAPSLSGVSTTRRRERANTGLQAARLEDQQQVRAPLNLSTRPQDDVQRSLDEARRGKAREVHVPGAYDQRHLMPRTDVNAQSHGYQHAYQEPDQQPDEQSYWQPD